MLVGLALGACHRHLPSDSLPPGATAVSSTPAPPLATPSSQPPLQLGGIAPWSFGPIAKRADPSVVTITTFGEEVEPSRFFGHARRRETKGLGTGFLVDKDGLILTNNHVVEGADQIRIKLSNDREFPARIIGKDARTDIAVVKIEGHDLPPLTLGDSDAAEV